MSELDVKSADRPEPTPPRIIFDKKDKTRYIVRFDVCPYTGECNRGLGVLHTHWIGEKLCSTLWVYTSWSPASATPTLYLNIPYQELERAKEAVLEFFGQVKPYHTYSY